MRKMLRLGLCLSVLAAALTCSALAADDKYTTSLNGGTVEYNTETKKYTASYDGAIEGNQYALLVVKAKDGVYEPISDDTIMYIDQTAADQDGKVSFEFIPKSTPDCVVLLGGVFDGEVTSPVTLGTLKGQGVTVSGSVTSYNPGNPVTLKLYKAGTEELVTETTIAAQSGNGKVTQDFTLNSVPAGASYDLEISKTGHTSYRLTGIPVEDVLDLGTLQLVSGDVDGNGLVTLQDQNTILRSDTYNLQLDQAAIKAADVDGSGSVNISDMNVVLSSSNYNKGAVNETYGNKGD